MGKRLARIEGHLGLAPMPAAEESSERSGREPVRETRPPRRPPGATHTVQTRGGPVEVTVRKVSPGRPGVARLKPTIGVQPPPAAAPAPAPAAGAPTAPAAAGSPDLLGMLGALGDVLGALQQGLGIGQPAPVAAEGEAVEVEPEAEPTTAADPSGENWMAAEGITGTG